MYMIEHYSHKGEYHWEEIETFDDTDEAEEAFKTYVRLYIGTSFRLMETNEISYSSAIKGGNRYEPIV